MKKVLKKTLLLLAGALALCGGFTVSADTFVMENNMRVPVTEAYEYINTIEPSAEYDPLSGASDIFCGADGSLYVADTLNSRIVKFDSEGNTVAEFKNEAERAFNQPEGVFVQDDGDIFVADTGNSRIVHLAPDGRYVEEFIKPESNLLSDDFAFQPSKIGISKTNLIYVLNKTNFEGVFTLDAENNFCGYTCDNKVGVSIFDKLLKIFGSEYQQQMTQKRLPAVVTNFAVSGNNIFACTGQKGTVSGKLAEYTTVGANLMPDFDYGINTDDSGEYSLSLFVDVDTLSESVVAVLDQKNGKVFEYSSSGDQIAVFGSIGSNRGEFELPVALCYGKSGELYVLDQSKGVIHVYRPTKFIQSVHKALEAYDAGDYDLSEQEWEKVLEYDESYTLAVRGIAKTYYKSGDYETSAEYYKAADDKEGYSEAYAKMRHEVYRKYFVYIVLAAIAAAVGLYFGIVAWKRRQFKFFYGYYKRSKR